VVPPVGIKSWLLKLYFERISFFVFPYSNNFERYLNISHVPLLGYSFGHEEGVDSIFAWRV